MAPSYRFLMTQILNRSNFSRNLEVMKAVRRAMYPFVDSCAGRTRVVPAGPEATPLASLSLACLFHIPHELRKEEENNCIYIKPRST
ncbi:hypothetical protein PGTUg99_014753 [Puccinia graminis f. sp. tritici]|uniref:Uncharacterized protein n=1 Tax=Puccinia graminis f. sp. tritici TaxID=56615 RepID=A0A5B0S364_PUCGR|nr:hypothetical protein PGTUg99_014753 [Puccinia graminis f. sp. tritici]